ncbi:MAG: putative bacteriophage protein, partial [Phenylobacterium sp.]|nr:putative bacteriophage protein [Phenylobacterium sp.]
YIDEITGTDWFANYVQTNLFNLLATVGTKVPQTDDGVHLLVTNANSSCAQGVRNGLFAPGIWTQAGFGQLAQNDNLPSGFYVYAQPLALQPTADRAARKAPVMQIAAKLAGAIDTAAVVVSVNR